MEHVPLMRLLSIVVAAGLDDLHEELARRGHTSLRPAHGFALNAILNGSRTASEIAARLGMTKQGAAKLVQHLLEQGYIQEKRPEKDGRRKPLSLTAKGKRAIALSVSIQESIEERWAEIAGAEPMSTARAVLEAVADHHSPDGLAPVRPPR